MTAPAKGAKQLVCNTVLGAMQFLLVSQCLHFKSGVPQGSCLGPTIFALTLNSTLSVLKLGASVRRRYKTAI
ncbi:hypothetical protein Ciccas_011884 [Cichlidogyrus casuarinus]|uniref:Reverse transcriptase domain-containing protein n=1 Tax=Cichlidogyrus casuarinus TaxID=1844966 RepID=A0ABD2PQ02_9PLAT